MFFFEDFTLKKKMNVFFKRLIKRKNEFGMGYISIQLNIEISKFNNKINQKINNKTIRAKILEI